MDTPQEVFPNDESKNEPSVKSGEALPEGAEKTPIEPGTIFDSEAELKGVLGVSGKEREGRFEEYRRKYVYQKEGLAEMQQAVREKIADHQEASEEELLTVAGEFAIRYGFSVDQLLATAAAIRKYEEKHKVVQEVLNRFSEGSEGRPAIDADAFFSAAFFENPIGEVEISAGPTLIYLKVHDPKDFYQVMKIQNYLYGFEAPDFSKTKEVEALSWDSHGTAKKIEKCLLAEIDGMVVVENSSLVDARGRLGARGSAMSAEQGMAEEGRHIFLHEEQHSVQEIFDNPEGAHLGDWEEIEKAQTEEEREVALSRFLREESKIMEARAKGEIIAYLTGQMDEAHAPSVIADLKRDFCRGGGSYDYYQNHAKKAEEFLLPRLGEKNRSLIESSIAKIFGEKYEATVLGGIEALETLLAGDYSKSMRARAGNLLRTVPLRRWFKEARLLKK